MAALAEEPVVGERFVIGDNQTEAECERVATPFKAALSGPAILLQRAQSPLPPQTPPP